MKAIQKHFLTAGIALVLDFAAGAQTFQNLDFESATVPLSQPSSPPGVPTVDVGIALPSWSVFMGTDQANQVMYNSQTLDTSAVSLIRDNYPSLSVIEGSFSVFLLGGYWPILNGSPTDTSLSQTGLVPASSQSIQFKTRFTSLQSMKSPD